MLIPRSPLPRRLVLAFTKSRWLATPALWLGVAVAAGLWGCQPPDTFLRMDGSGGQTSGLGGAGQGGTVILGVGGAFGTGGATGLGGGPGLGGATGTGGAAGSAAGGRTGTGGAGVAGTTGTGGRGTGGAVGSGGAVGAGGAPDGGAADRPGAGGAVGTGGAIGTGGATGMDAGSDADGGTVGGTGPCAGLCANPIIIMTSQLPSTNQGTEATCYESTLTHQGGNCGNFQAPRTFSINGTVVPACNTGGNFNLPARVNGGYCFQSTAGQPAFAYFGLF